MFGGPGLGTPGRDIHRQTIPGYSHSRDSFGTVIRFQDIS